MNKGIKEKILSTYTEYQSEIEEISNYLFENPELSDEEYKSAEYLAEALRKHGFKVTLPYCKLPTAFRAEFGTGKSPKIAILAEYDALPGYGEERRPAHACGHNWIAAHALGTAIVLTKALDSFDGTVVVMGTPAEETVGRKFEMINEGAFEDIDAVFQLHLERETSTKPIALALDSYEFKFHGKAAHAAGAPQDGINALDAVQLTFAGINALRQHVTTDVKIHGIVTEGGVAPNIVPDLAACKFYIRAGEREYLNTVTEKVINCARGAALMTGARLEYSIFENPFDNIKTNEVLRQNLIRDLIDTGFDCNEEEPESSGSSDIGNVSYVVPTSYMELKIGDGPGAHDEEFLKLVNSEQSNDLLKTGIIALAQCMERCFSDKEILIRARAEFNDRP